MKQTKALMYLHNILSLPLPKLENHTETSKTTSEEKKNESHCSTFKLQFKWKRLSISIKIANEKKWEPSFEWRIIRCCHE